MRVHLIRLPRYRARCVNIETREELIVGVHAASSSSARAHMEDNGFHVHQTPYLEHEPGRVPRKDRLAKEDHV